MAPHPAVFYWEKPDSTFTCSHWGVALFLITSVSEPLTYWYSSHMETMCSCEWQMTEPPCCLLTAAAAALSLPVGLVLLDLCRTEPRQFVSVEWSNNQTEKYKTIHQVVVEKKKSKFGIYCVQEEIIETHLILLQHCIFFFLFLLGFFWAVGLPPPSQQAPDTFTDTHTHTQCAVVAACVVGRLNIFLLSLGSS